MHATELLKWLEIACINACQAAVADEFNLDRDGSIVLIREAEDSEQQTGEDVTDDNVIADLGRRRVSKRYNAEWKEH
jgi:hypothetical protein